MFILGGITLPSPQGFRKSPILIGADVETMSGKTRRDYVRKKYRYTLMYSKLTQTEMIDILSLWNQNNTLFFSVDEGSLQIASVEVLMDMSDREYNTPGSEFREDLEVTLTEV